MRSCENCGARVPAGATSCPECGVYAGTYVEGQAVHPKKPRYALWLSLLAVAAAIAAVSYLLLAGVPLPMLTRQKPVVRKDTTPVRVVRDRPGGAFRAKGALITEPEAVLLLRRNFPQLKPECVAILGNGYHDGAYQMTVVNSCDGTRLGRWRVDGRTRVVSAGSPGGR